MSASPRVLPGNMVDSRKADSPWSGANAFTVDETDRGWVGDGDDVTEALVSWGNQPGAVAVQPLDDRVPARRLGEGAVHV